MVTWIEGGESAQWARVHLDWSGQSEPPLRRAPGSFDTPPQAVQTHSDQHVGPAAIGLVGAPRDCPRIGWSSTRERSGGHPVGIDIDEPNTGLAERS